MPTYKEQVEELANQYWHARRAEFDPESTEFIKESARKQQRAIWERMGHVPADALPEWVDPELVAMADRFAMNERTAREDLHGTPIVCKGSWPFDDAGYGIDKRLGEGWDDHEDYRDGFRAVWTNDRLRAVITYCEGDFTLCILPDEDAYRGYLAYMDRFYLSLRS